MSKAQSKKAQVEAEPISEKDTARQLVQLLTPYMAIVPPFSYAASQRCEEKGLLPPSLLGHLEVLQFLACTVLSAQKAQRRYGVRASVLLGMALFEVGVDANCLVKRGKLFDDYDGTPSIGAEVDEWFLTRAKMLTTSKKFRAASDSISDPKLYIGRLCALGFYSDMDRDDIWSWIEQHDLQACDLPGMLPIGEYQRWVFDPVYDSQKHLVGLTFSEAARMLRLAKKQPADAAA